jgi:hypothetical protein
MEPQTGNRRIIFIILAVVLVAVVGLSLFARSSNSGSPLNPGGKKGTVRVMFNLPDTSQLNVTLNDKPLKITGVDQTVTLSATKYSFKATRPGYNAFTTSFTLKDGAHLTLNVTMQRDQSKQDTLTTPEQIPSIDTTVANMSVTDVQYFYQKTWAFVTLQQDGNTAYAVVKYNPQSADWDVFSGPGTSFSSSSVQGAPSDVFNYMQQNEFLYEDQGE